MPITYKESIRNLFCPFIASYRKLNTINSKQFIASYRKLNTINSKQLCTVNLKEQILKGSSSQCEEKCGD
jgi:hypothetical protein